jgi:GNAT superfamily N-acetyltransferase
MKIIRVSDSATVKMFHDAAREIYKDDESWVCPLDNDIEEVFTPGKNTYFNHGEAERWIAIDENGKPAGRIAAFIDKNLAPTWDQPTGGTGYFECINDRQTAFMLFDTAKEWLASRGMEAMDGPINFGEPDKYWGLLIDGFTQPSFEVPYNPPYYRELFESYGFQKFYGMEGFHVDLTKPFPERYRKITEWILRKPGYTFRYLKWRQQKKMVSDFADVFNAAWPSFKKNFEPVETEYINNVLKKVRPIARKKFIWIAYFNDKPVGILFLLPDLNQILKHFNGRLDFFSKLKFLYLKKTNTITRLKGLIMGVKPEFQGHGIESALFLQLYNELVKRPYYKEIELSWVADFNPKMRRIFQSTGGYSAKKYITYRYLFDRKKEFKRYPIPDILN